MKSQKIFDEDGKIVDDNRYNISYNDSLSSSLGSYATSATGNEEERIVRQPQHIVDCVQILRKRGLLDEKRAAGILYCVGGTDVDIVCANCLEVARIKYGRCGNRLCMLCVRLRKARAYNQIIDIFREFKYLRFLTLGFKNTETISNAYFKECSGALKKMKIYLARAKHPQRCLCGRCDYGRISIVGYEFGTYANVLEVKHHHAGEPRYEWTYDSSLRKKIKKQQVRNGEPQFYGTREWNTHYHLVYDGDYIPQSVLQDCFERATGGESHQAYIEGMEKYFGQETRPENMLRYIVKYVTKLDGHNFDPQVIADFYEATKGIRFFNTSIKKKDKLYKKQDTALCCTTCGANSWLTPFDGEAYPAALGGRTGLRENAAILPVYNPPKDKRTKAQRREDERAALRAEQDAHRAYLESVTQTVAEPSPIEIIIQTLPSVMNYLQEHGLSEFEQMRTDLSVPEEELRFVLRRLCETGDVYEPKAGWYGIP